MKLVCSTDEMMQEAMNCNESNLLFQTSLKKKESTLFGLVALELHQAYILRIPLLILCGFLFL